MSEIRHSELAFPGPGFLQKDFPNYVNMEQRGSGDSYPHEPTSVSEVTVLNQKSPSYFRSGGFESSFSNEKYNSIHTSRVSVVPHHKPAFLSSLNVSSNEMHRCNGNIKATLEDAHNVNSLWMEDNSCINFEPIIKADILSHSAPRAQSQNHSSCPQAVDLQSHISRVLYHTETNHDLLGTFPQTRGSVHQSQPLVQPPLNPGEDRQARGLSALPSEPSPWGAAAMTSSLPGDGLPPHPRYIAPVHGRNTGYLTVDLNEPHPQSYRQNHLSSHAAGPQRPPAGACWVCGAVLGAFESLERHLQRHHHHLHPAGQHGTQRRGTHAAPRTSSSDWQQQQAVERMAGAQQRFVPHGPPSRHAHPPHVHHRAPLSLADYLQVSPYPPQVPQARGGCLGAPASVTAASIAQYYRGERQSAGATASNPNKATSTVVQRRGKERVEPKKKKLSALKKVILKERAGRAGGSGIEGVDEGDKAEEPRCHSSSTSDSCLSQEGSGDVEAALEKLMLAEHCETEAAAAAAAAGGGGKGGGSPCVGNAANVLLSVEAVLVDKASSDSSKHSSHGLDLQLERGKSEAASVSSVETGSPASKSEERKGGNNTYIGPDVDIRYCNQVITTELNQVALEVLRELIRFQERAKVRDPNKAKKKRRLVVGLREVARAVRSKRAKSIIVAPNIEEIKAEGGLDCTLQSILDDAAKNEVQVVFALTRSRIAQAFGRRVRMSTVAICDYDGVNDQHKQMLKLAEEGRKQWADIHGNSRA